MADFYFDPVAEMSPVRMINSDDDVLGATDGDGAGAINQALQALTNRTAKNAVEAKKHGIRQYDPTVDYELPSFVTDADGNLYQALVANGPNVENVGAKPLTDTDYWTRVKNEASPVIATNYNTLEVITESGDWTAPVDGWYKVTCIGGGGAGGSGGQLATNGANGTAGGATTFGNITAEGGIGGGGGGYRGEGSGSIGGGGGGGGGCGYVTTAIIKLNAGDTIPVIVGGGGIVGVIVYIENKSGIGGTGGNGASNGSTGHGAPSINTATVGGNGGAGGYNGTNYGGGGGGGGGYALALPGVGGNASANASIGADATTTQGGDGGNGDDGAVILEYYMQE